MDKEKLTALLNGFDPTKFIPKLDSVLGKVELVTRIAVLAGPIILLVLGLIYLFIPPKQANRSLGYRCYWGMGSEEAWCFTQKIAGMAWSALGLVLTVVMLVITNGYRGMEAMDMVWSAVRCLLWQLGLVICSCLAIDICAMIFFDRKGDHRREPKPKAPREPKPKVPRPARPRRERPPMDTTPPEETE